MVLWGDILIVGGLFEIKEEKKDKIKKQFQNKIDHKI